MDTPTQSSILGSRISPRWTGILVAVALGVQSWSRRAVSDLENPKRPPFVHRIREEYAKGNFKAAIEMADREVNRRPGEPDAYAIRADVKFAWGDPAGALGDYDQAMALAPKDWPLFEAVKTKASALRKRAEENPPSGSPKK